MDLITPPCVDKCFSEDWVTNQAAFGPCTATAVDLIRNRAKECYSSGGICEADDKALDWALGIADLHEGEYCQQFEDNDGVAEVEIEVDADVNVGKNTEEGADEEDPEENAVPSGGNGSSDDEKEKEKEEETTGKVQEDEADDGKNATSTDDAENGVGSVKVSFMGSLVIGLTFLGMVSL